MIFRKAREADPREDALLREVASLPVPDPGEGFWAALPPRVRARVRAAADERAASRVPRWAWAFGASTAAAAAVLLFSLVPRGVPGLEEYPLLSLVSVGEGMEILPRGASLEDVEASLEPQFDEEESDLLREVPSVLPAGWELLDLKGEDVLELEDELS